VVDVAGFGDPRRTNLHQVAVRQGLYDLLTLAFEQSGIPWQECHNEDRGDGVLVLVAPDVPKQAFVESLPRELLAGLRRHNGSRGAQEQIRLRMALHAGEVHYDEHGVVGRSVNLAFRLLDAEVFKDALARSAALLGVITSAWFYEEVVWHGPGAEAYVQVRVTVKETEATAWICLPDAGVPAVVAPVSPSVPSAPHQLPAGARQFVGRVAELDRLTGLLDDAARADAVVITAIDGTAGIGKTTLAMHWAHRVKSRFPDGQLHVNLRGFDPREPLDPAQALHGFLQALGVGADAIPGDLEAKAALYRSLLAERTMLVLVDNARSSDHVRPLLPGSPTCLVLITSRQRLDGLVVREGAYRIELDALPREDAQALLAERIGGRRLTGEPRAAAELAELCVRLPLALSIVAARAEGQPDMPLAALVRELRDERNRLDSLDLGDIDLSLRAVFSWSYNELSADAARLFRLLGVHPGPDIDRYACAALTGSVTRAGALLKELTASHLIAEHTVGRFRFHDLLRAYAIELVESEDHAAERTEAAEVLLGYYLRAASRADRIIQPCRDGVVRVPDAQPQSDGPGITNYAEAIAWYAAESGVLLGLVTFALDRGFAEYAWQLAWASTTFLRRSGRWQERVSVHRTAVAATGRSGDRRAQATAKRHLAQALARQNEYDEAHDLLCAAAEVVDVSDDSTEAVATHLACARVLKARGDDGEALEHARHAWELVRETGDVLGQGDALSELGKQLSLSGNDHAEALRLCERALDHYSMLRHQEGQADVLLNLAAIELRLGRPEWAAQRARESLELDRLLGDRYWEAKALELLGDACIAAGDRIVAGQVWRESLAIFTDLRHPDADRLRSNLANLRSDLSGDTH
jgi:tetratricopeptide (TPR) repeat protein